jgi:hypothetical protein
MKKKSLRELTLKEMKSLKGGHISWYPNRFKTHLVISPLWIDTDKIFVEIPKGVELEP